MGEHQEKRTVISPWMSEGSLNLAIPLHEMPRKYDKVLPKFDLDRPILPKDHIKDFFLANRFLNVQHEDMVCRVFAYTFSGKVSTWY
jgi:hypothetical protein